MKYKHRLYLLGIYDLFLSIGAIYIGLRWIISPNAEYPEEWLIKVPFKNWLLPGVIGIVVFGLGNITAAKFSFRNKGSISWLVSAVMAGIFFFSMVAQYLIFKQWYLPAAELFILSIIQLLLCGFTFLGYRKAALKSEA